IRSHPRPGLRRSGHRPAREGRPRRSRRARAEGSRRTPHRSPVEAARRDAGRRPRPPGGTVVTVMLRTQDPTGTEAIDRARAAAGRVRDPEMPMLTLVDLGVLRDVSIEDGRVVATITPTYSGCPAMATMRDDLQRELLHAGFEDAEVRVSLSPAWTSDWITEAGRKALQDAGISPPGQAPRHEGPVALTLKIGRASCRGSREA